MPDATTPAGRASLERECRVFCRYLVHQEPSRYVVQKYCDANSALRRSFSDTRLDDLLLRLACRRPFWARLADAYSRIMAPGSALRAKLIVMLAILETSAPSDAYFRPQAGTPLPTAYLQLVWQGFSFVVTAATALLLLGPLHLLVRMRRRSHARAHDPAVNGA